MDCPDDSRATWRLWRSAERSISAQVLGGEQGESGGDVCMDFF